MRVGECFPQRYSTRVSADYQSHIQLTVDLTIKKSNCFFGVPNEQHHLLCFVLFYVFATSFNVPISVARVRLNQWQWCNRNAAVFPVLSNSVPGNPPNSVLAPLSPTSKSEAFRTSSIIAKAKSTQGEISDFTVQERITK